MQAQPGESPPPREPEDRLSFTAEGDLLTGPGDGALSGSSPGENTGPQGSSIALGPEGLQSASATTQPGLRPRWSQEEALAPTVPTALGSGPTARTERLPFALVVVAVGAAEGAEPSDEDQVSKQEPSPWGRAEMEKGDVEEQWFAQGEASSHPEEESATARTGSWPNAPRTQLRRHAGLLGLIATVAVLVVAQRVLTGPTSSPPPAVVPVVAPAVEAAPLPTPATAPRVQARVMPEPVALGEPAALTVVAAASPKAALQKKALKKRRPVAESLRSR